MVLCPRFVRIKYTVPGIPPRIKYTVPGIPPGIPQNYKIPLDMLSALLYYLYITYTGDDAMITKISTADVRKNFSNIVNRVSFGKESIILTRRGEEIAALVAMDELRLLQELEDRIDIADAIKAIKEQGEDIPAEQFWKKLGL
jgi:antitoxin Phd